MPRRGHKKSRLGCLECKKRHVKCDENNVPGCVNCKTAGIKCSYTDRLRPSNTSSGTSPTVTHSVSQSPAAHVESGTSTGDSGTHSFSPPQRTSPNNKPESLVNFGHLELLHNFSTETYKSFIVDEAAAMRHMRLTVRLGLEHPFLMYEVLALSALHLSILRPAHSTTYRDQAAALQALALEGFNRIVANIDDSNCVPVFLFSSLIGTQSFCEAFAYRDEDFNSFLDKLTHGISILRGVRIVSSQSWETLRTSELSEVLEAGRRWHYSPSIEPGSTAGESEECKQLRELIGAADLSETSLRAYENAITHLQKVFNAERRLPNKENSVSMLFAWLIMSDVEYTNLLSQRRPEALIILAYYAIMLFNRRASWAVQDAGQFLIKSITNYLGRHWSRWLQLPNSIIDETLANVDATN